MANFCQSCGAPVNGCALLHEMRPANRGQRPTAGICSAATSSPAAAASTPPVQYQQPPQYQSAPAYQAPAYQAPVQPATGGGGFLGRFSLIVVVGFPDSRPSSVLQECTTWAAAI